jgi:hypothetical protein
MGNRFRNASAGLPAQPHRVGRRLWAVRQRHREELGVNRNTVILGRRRFQQEGLDGWWEIAPGRGLKPTYGPEKVASIEDATLRTKPEGMTQRSCRLMATSPGVSKSTINSGRAALSSPIQASTLNATKCRSETLN